jgi:hypothetical protein
MEPLFMRIYEGSPRQDFEEVLRSIGSFADREQLKEILLLEMEGGYLLQGLAIRGASADSDAFGTLAKRLYELTDDQVAELMDQETGHRGEATEDQPHAGYDNYYQQALRVIGTWIDRQRPHDVFLFEQEGGFVLRLFAPVGSHGSGHQLAEFTRDEILAMIEAAPDQRNRQPATPPAVPPQAGEQQA